MLFWLLLGLLIACADQATKAVVSSGMSVGQDIAVIPHVLSITRIHNSGAAFGLFTSQTVLLSIISFVVIFCAVVWHRRLISQPMHIKLAMSLALGGALGNLIDRLRLGYVIDFLHISYCPIFNLADIAIVSGVGLLLVYIVRDSKRDESDPQDTACEAGVTRK